MVRLSRSAHMESVVRGVCISPDGRSLVSCGHDGSVAFHDLVDGSFEHVLVDRRRWYSGVTHRPHNCGRLPYNSFAVSSYDQCVYVFSKCPARDDKDRICAVCEDPELTALFGQRAGSAARVPGLNPGFHAYRVQVDQFLSCVAWHGDMIAAGSHNGVIRMIDVRTGATYGPPMIIETCHEVAFDPAGRDLVAASVDGTVSIWDLETAKMKCVMAGHGESVMEVPFPAGCTTCQFTADGNGVISGGGDEQVILYDARAKSAVRYYALPSGVFEIRLSPDGHTVHTACHDGRLIDLDMRAGAERAIARETRPFDEFWATCVSLNEDGSMVAVGTAGGTVEVIDGVAAEGRRKVHEIDRAMKVEVWGNEPTVAARVQGALARGRFGDVL
jgi:WD40 repeat protein